MPQGDTQADMTERARDVALGIRQELRGTPFTDDGDYLLLPNGYLAIFEKHIVAALQSESEAAAAEARRAAIEECAALLRRAAEISDPGWPTQQKFKRMIAETCALASPAPQEKTQ